MPPRVWLQSSTATIYADTYGPPNAEDGELGGNEPDLPDTWRFSLDVARHWEQAADGARVRTVLLRSAMVMSPDRGGVFDTLLRAGPRGPRRARRQRAPVRLLDPRRTTSRAAIALLIAREDVAGPVNLASPNPLPYAEFMRALRAPRACPSGCRRRSWMLEVGAFFMRTETELVLKSRRVVPGRLLEAGFAFEHPEWPEAARELAARRRAPHPG